MLPSKQHRRVRVLLLCAVVDETSVVVVDETCLHFRACSYHAFVHAKHFHFKRFLQKIILRCLTTRLQHHRYVAKHTSKISAYSLRSTDFIPKSESREEEQGLST